MKGADDPILKHTARILPLEQSSTCEENSQQPKLNLCYDAATSANEVAEPMFDAINDKITRTGRGKSASTHHIP